MFQWIKVRKEARRRRIADEIHGAEIKNLKTEVETLKGKMQYVAQAVEGTRPALTTASPYWSPLFDMVTVLRQSYSAARAQNEELSRQVRNLRLKAKRRKR